MPRTSRNAPGGTIFHVLNRANNRAKIFATDGDFYGFIKVVSESLLAVPTRILGYCIMPNHWHFVLWPETDDELADFLHQITTTHVRRWHEFHETVGLGHIYQGPYKSFPVQDDGHFFTVCRYVERNPVRAGLVAYATDWMWCSAWARPHAGAREALPLTEWPICRPDDWEARVDRAMTEGELNDIRTCIRRGRPYGEAPWQLRIARQLGLESTLRARGRPRRACNV